MEVNIDGLYETFPLIEAAISGCNEAIGVLGSVQVPEEHVSASINSINAAIGSLERGKGAVNSVIERVMASEASNNQIVNSLAGYIGGFSFGASATNEAKTTTGNISGNNTIIDKNSKTKTNASDAVSKRLANLAIFKLFKNDTAKKITNSILEDYSNGKIDISKMTDEELNELIYKKAETYIGKDTVRIMKAGGYSEEISQRINKALLEDKIDLANKTDKEFKQIIENRAIAIGAVTVTTDELFTYFNKISNKYGYDPEYLQKIFNCTDGENKNVEEFFNIKTKLEKDYNMTNTAEAANFIKSFKNANMDTYTSVANALLAQYKDDPEAFQKKFGVALYTMDSKGLRTLNNDVLLDIFVTVNRDSVKNSTNTVTMQENVQGTKTFDEVLTNYFKGKKVEFSNASSAASKFSLSENTNTAKSTINDAIEKKQYVTIQLKKDNEHKIDFIDTTTNKTIFNTGDMKEETIEVYVTGCTDDGVITSYNGNRCIINFSNFKNNYSSYSIQFLNLRKY